MKKIFWKKKVSLFNTLVMYYCIYNPKITELERPITFSKMSLGNVWLSFPYQLENEKVQCFRVCSKKTVTGIRGNAFTTEASYMTCYEHPFIRYGSNFLDFLWSTEKHSYTLGHFISVGHCRSPWVKVHDPFILIVTFKVLQ